MTETITLEETIRKILIDLRFPVHQNGYQLLCVAIPLFARRPDISLTKELYPLLAKQFGCDVESSIRRSILCAWKAENREIWNHCFPQCRQAPSNLVFIATLAERLK